MFNHSAINPVRRIGRLLTWLLLLFELVLPFIRAALGDGTMQVIDSTLWFPLLIYINFQFAETNVRDSADLWGFFMDNAPAFAVILTGFAIVILWSVGTVSWLPAAHAEEYSSMWKCLAFGGSDFIWGIMFGMRIAGGWKERAESRSPGRSAQ